MGQTTRGRVFTFDMHRYLLKDEKYTSLHFTFGDKYILKWVYKELAEMFPTHVGIKIIDFNRRAMHDTKTRLIRARQFQRTPDIQHDRDPSSRSATYEKR